MESTTTIDLVFFHLWHLTLVGLCAIFPQSLILLCCLFIKNGTAVGTQRYVPTLILLSKEKFKQVFANFLINRLLFLLKHWHFIFSVKLRVRILVYNSTLIIFTGILIRWTSFSNLTIWICSSWIEMGLESTLAVSSGLENLTLPSHRPCWSTSTWVQQSLSSPQRDQNQPSL